MPKDTQIVKTNQVARTWVKIDLVLADIKADRLKLGELFLQAQKQYSNKSADVRRLGVGTFEQEIEKRIGPNGRPLRTRTVRGWIEDFKAHHNGTQTTSEKRKACRQRTPSADYRKGYADGYKKGYSEGAAFANVDKPDGHTSNYARAN